MGSPPRLRSRDVTEGPARAPARAYLRAVGLGEDDFDKPQVGIASAGNEVTPCNLGLDEQADLARAEVWARGCVGLRFNTIAVSDGIAMGHEGMRASLPSREWIADSVELMFIGERFDALVALAGCDKSLPGMLMAAARLDVPSVFLYGGTIMPGCFNGRDVSIQDVFEGVGAHAAGLLSDEDFLTLEQVACPTRGSCGGMFTANTTACAGEALGMSLPFSASVPSADPRRDDVARATGATCVAALEADLRPRRILTKEAFENAIAVVMAVGGSTNAVLHLLAIAHDAGVDLTIEDFDRVSRRTPQLCDMRPFGKYLMTDLDRAGGVPAVMRELLDHGLLHGDALTVTGATVAENLAAISVSDDQDVLHRVDDPLMTEGGICILRGSLAPEGSVMKTAGGNVWRHEGPARVFDGEQDAFDAIVENRVEPGSVVVIRYEGPKGGPGMREMLAVTAAAKGSGIGSRISLVTDGRFSGASHGHNVAHIAPEAVDGGPIALVRDGDVIVVDPENRVLELRVPDDELERRRREWTPPAPRYTRGVLGRYIRLVGSASRGAVCDEA